MPYKRSPNSFACPDEFLAKAHIMCPKLFKQQPKALNILQNHNYMRMLIKLQPMYLESLRPCNYGKVAFVKFRPANRKKTGDIHAHIDYIKFKCQLP